MGSYRLRIASISFGLLGLLGCKGNPGPGLKLQLAESASQHACLKTDKSGFPLSAVLRDGSVRLSVLQKQGSGWQFQCDIKATLPDDHPSIDLGTTDRSQYAFFAELFDAIEDALRKEMELADQAGGTMKDDIQVVIDMLGKLASEPDAVLPEKCVPLFAPFRFNVVASATPTAAHRERKSARGTLAVRSRGRPVARRKTSWSATPSRRSARNRSRMAAMSELLIRNDCSTSKSDRDLGSSVAPTKRR